MFISQYSHGKRHFVFFPAVRVLVFSVSCCAICGVRYFIAQAYDTAIRCTWHALNVDWRSSTRRRFTKNREPVPPSKTIAVWRQKATPHHTTSEHHTTVVFIDVVSIWRTSMAQDDAQSSHKKQEAPPGTAYNWSLFVFSSSWKTLPRENCISQQRRTLAWRPPKWTFVQLTHTKRGINTHCSTVHENVNTDSFVTRNQQLVNPVVSDTRLWRLFHSSYGALRYGDWTRTRA